MDGYGGECREEDYEGSLGGAEWYREEQFGEVLEDWPDYDGGDGG